MTIRAPYITPPKDVAGPSLLSITTASLALTAVVVAVLPFNNSAAVARTPVPVALSAPDQVHTDISIFTNPIPFAQAQWGSVLSLNSLPTPPRVIPYNQNLYSTVAANPFIPPQFGSALSLNSLPTPPRVVPYNQLIYSEVPFSQSDWPRTVAVRYNPPQAQPYNPLILSEIPTSSVDYSKPFNVRSSPPQAQPYNAAAYSSPNPFVPVDYNKPFSVANVAPSLSLQGYNLGLFGQTIVPFNVPFDVVRTPNFVQQAGSYNLSLYGQVAVVAPPFAQLDWPKPSLPQLAVSQVAPTNINLFTNSIPFALYDWNKPSAYGPSKAALPTSSVALLTAVQAPPFVPVDYSKPYFPRNQIDATQPANPSSFTNPQPFIPVDYNTTRQNPNFQIWAQGYNVNLFVPPVIIPPVDDGVRGSETILTDRRGAGGYSRKQYDEFVKAKRAALARKLKKKPAAEVRLAVELAEQAVLKAGLLGSFAPSIEPLIEALNDADTLATAQEAARVAEMLLMQMEDDDEDDMMIILSSL